MRVAMHITLLVFALALNGIIIGGFLGLRFYWLVYRGEDGIHGISVAQWGCLALGGLGGFVLGVFSAILWFCFSFSSKGLLYSALTGRGPTPPSHQESFKLFIIIGSLILPILAGIFCLFS